MSDEQYRRELVLGSRALVSRGLISGTSGNCSIRTDHGFLITPSGLPYEKMTEQDIVFVNRDGEGTHPSKKPSSEWRMHLDLYRAREDVRAVVHTHSSFATALACNGRSIPAFHYMVAVVGGDSIRCADYATFGSQELSDHALRAMQGRKACLLANHGVLVAGETLQEGLRLAEAVEELARQYVQALQVGEPRILDAEEMQKVLKKFENYGVSSTE